MTSKLNNDTDRECGDTKAIERKLKHRRSLDNQLPKGTKVGTIEGHVVVIEDEAVIMPDRWGNGRRHKKVRCKCGNEEHKKEIMIKRSIKHKAAIMCKECFLNLPSNKQKQLWFELRYGRYNPS